MQSPGYFLILRHKYFLSNSFLFLIHESSLLFDATKPEILKASLNKQQIKQI